MKKLIQTKLHNPPEIIGNCFATVIACLLEIEIEEVPAVEELFDTDQDWVNLMQKFVNEKGYLWLSISNKNEVEKDEFYIAIGPSPRGVSHAVIYKNGELYHDPHPSGLGILEVKHLEYLEKL